MTIDMKQLMTNTIDVVSDEISEQLSNAISEEVDIAISDIIDNIQNLASTLADSIDTNRIVEKVVEKHLKDYSQHVEYSTSQPSLKWQGEVFDIPWHIHDAIVSVNTFNKVAKMIVLATDPSLPISELMKRLEVVRAVLLYHFDNQE